MIRPRGTLFFPLQKHILHGSAEQSTASVLPSTPQIHTARARESSGLRHAERGAKQDPPRRHVPPSTACVPHSALVHSFLTTHVTNKATNLLASRSLTLHPSIISLGGVTSPAVTLAGGASPDLVSQLGCNGRCHYENVILSLLVGNTKT